MGDIELRDDFDIRITAQFPHPLIIAGGSFKTAEQIRKAAKTDTIPEWGSITTDGLPGNGGRDYYAEYADGHLLWTVNSLGLPNPGMRYVESHARSLIALYDDCGKSLIINISGNGVDDTLELLKRALACGFRVVTVNGACPNKKGQPILCRDKEAVDELFERMEREIGHVDALILWKVSLGMTEDLLAHNCARVGRSRVVGGIITGNTVPNVRLYRGDGTLAIKTANGLAAGGLAGPVVYALALEATEYCAKALPKEKVKVHCGGIGTPASGRTALERGADYISMQSAWREANEDHRFVTSFLERLGELMQH